MYWCWKPRFSDTEGNDFGMTRPDGTPLKRTLAVGKTAHLMEELSPFFDSSEHTSLVAVFSSQKINHLMDAEKMGERYIKAVEGAVNILHDLHINVDFVCEESIINGSLKKYKALVLPTAYIMSDECGAAIETYANEGGTVIADFLLAEKRPGGICYRTLPGAGLHKVMGVEREDVRLIEHPTQFTEGATGLRLGATMEILCPTSAEALEKYNEDEPLITLNRYGKGNGIYFAGMLFSSYGIEPTAAARETFKDILKTADVFPACELEKSDTEGSPTLITSQLYSTENGELCGIVVSHIDFGTASDSIILPRGEYEVFEDNGSSIITDENEATKISFTLDEWQSILIKKK